MPAFKRRRSGNGSSAPRKRRRIVRRKFSTRRRAFSRRRSSFRKRGFRRRRSYRRRRFSRRSRSRRAMTLTAPNYTGNRSLFTKFVMRPRISTAWLVPNTGAVASNRYTVAANCLGIIQLGPTTHGSATPDTFPPVGHSGCLITFSLDVYIRAMFANWLSANRSAVGLDADTVGTEFVRCSEELRYRRLNIDYNRSNLYKIELIFSRKAGRSTANASVVPSYDNSTGAIAAPEGAGTFGPTISTPVINQAGNWIANTGGELNWFSQATNEHINPGVLMARMILGFPRDGISGSTTAIQNARTIRLLQEMGSREWKKHSGMSSLRFTIRKQRGSNNQLVVAQSTSSTTEIGLSNGYTVGNDNLNGFDNDNSTENKNQGRLGTVIVDPSNLSPGASDGIIGTIPASNGPRGSIVIWSPYNAAFLEAYYDIIVIGHYQFKDKGKSIIDSNVANVGDLE